MGMDIRLIRVAWVPTAADINRASYRLSCYYNHLWLKEHGVQSEVLDYLPTKSLKGLHDLVIWQRCDEPAASNVLKLEVPYILYISDGPVPSNEVLWESEKTITDSSEVQRVRYSYSQIIPVTSPGDVKRKFHVRNSQTPSSSSLVWVGTEQNYRWSEEILKYLKEYYTIKIISIGDFADVQWKLETVSDEIQCCSIGILPYPRHLNFGDTKGFNPLLKDPDRISLLQACGLPVIAAPLPTWKNYITSGIDGIIADGPEEFREAIQRLLMNPVLYNSMASLGWSKAWSFCSPTVTGNMWLKLIKETVKI